jgi:toxin ParE1/3/4
MARVRLSCRASADLAEIADYTIERFGIEQARNYRGGIEQAFERLALHPEQGAGAEHLSPGLRRMGYKSHIIFYRVEGDGILIVRIPHQRMDVQRQAMTDN